MRIDPSDAPSSPIRTDRLHLAVHPNPFQPRTTLVYELPKPGRVSFTAYDAHGRRVAMTAEAHQSAGRYSVELKAPIVTGGHCRAAST
jgi:hypothetical protein